MVVRHIRVHVFKIEEALRAALKMGAGVPGALAKYDPPIAWNAECLDVFDPGLRVRVVKARWRGYGDEPGMAAN